MKKLLFLLLVSAVGTGYAMEEGDSGKQLCLREFAKADLKNIVLSYYNLTEDHDAQKARVIAFFGNLHNDVTKEEGGDDSADIFTVNTFVLRKDLKELIKHLPKGQEEIVDLSSFEGIKQSGSQLWDSIGRYGKFGLYVGGAGTIFVSGMIFGWWKARQMEFAGDFTPDV